MPLTTPPLPVTALAATALPVSALAATALAATIHRSAVLVCDLAMVVLPDGGQRAARRNAWAGMSRDAARARAQREADAAVALAAARARVAEPAGPLGVVAHR